jgi:hypothetical protein
MKKILLLLAVSVFTTVSFAQKNKKPNILFIAVDDLKPELGCYGNKIIKTPNIDRLAKMGTVFLNNYCQQAVCGPTRASLMTGMRPDATKVWDLKTKMRDMLEVAIEDVILSEEMNKINNLLLVIKTYFFINILITLSAISFVFTIVIPSRLSSSLSLSLLI